MDRNEDTAAAGRAGLSLATHRRPLTAAAVLSLGVNLLTLTGPLFMLLVYDSVLPARSAESLTALALLMAALFLALWLLDVARTRILARIGCRVQALVEGPAMAAALRKAAESGQPPTDPSRDLDAVRQLYAAQVLPAAFDLPWVPLFLAGIFLLHPALGLLALAGGGALVALSIFGRWRVAHPAAAAHRAGACAARDSSAMLAAAPDLDALGVRGGLTRRWRAARRTALAAESRAADSGGATATAARSLRLFLQSAMLGLAAALVLAGAMTPGGMFAASILMGRALAPIDLIIAQWPVVQRGLLGRAALRRLLATPDHTTGRTALPPADSRLGAEQVTVVPPGSRAATLRLVSFELRPGQALGVIGPSGSGKSSLARAAAGVWPVAGGALRLGGIEIGRLHPALRAREIGYLPQEVRLFPGTVAQNIARFAENPESSAVAAAAQAAGVHEAILGLPQGYDTLVGAFGEGLSGGQRQRVALARALFGAPRLLVLDEPDAHLDHEGCAALDAAVRAATSRGATVLLSAHRPAALAACQSVLVLEGGARRAFGPREAVLAETVRNADALRVESAGGAP